MSNYTKTTDFEAKDSLPTGDSGKIIRGSEFETEFDAISTAIATKADTAGPTFTGTLTFETISDGTINVTAFVDEDNMASNSATLVPTQQSVKAYVDSQVTAQDLDFQADSGGALSIDLDSETMTFTGGTGIDTSGSGNAVTFAIDSTVATLAGSQTLTNKTLTSPVLNTGVSGTAVLDEDDMSSNSATQLATQQSIKAYVDAQITAEDLDFQADSGGALSIDLDSETLTFTGGTGIDTSGSGNAVTFAIDSTVATLTGSQTLTNKSLTAPTLTGTSVVASLDISGDIDVDGTTNLDVVDIDGAVDFASTTAHAGNASFADNAKAIFGAGSDLQIYHDGSNSYIKENGTGALNIHGQGNINLKNSAGDETLAVFTTNSGVTLYHDNSAKFATTSTGIDVTGTVTADGLTVDGTVGIGTSSPSELLEISSATGSATIDPTVVRISSATSASDWSTTSAWGVLGFYSADTSGGGAGNRAQISTNMEAATGAYSSLNFTLANPGNSYAQDSWLKLQNSASSSSRQVIVFADGGLDISADGTSAMRLSDSSSPATFAQITQANGVLAFNADAGGSQSNSVMKFLVDNSETMRIDSSGNVGIGTTSPAFAAGAGLEIEQAGTATLRLQDTTNTANGEIRSGPSGIEFFSGAYGTSGNPFSFSVAGTTALTINSSRNVGIGTSSPSSELHVKSSDSEVALNLEATTARLKINTNNFISATSSVTTFGVNGTEAMRLNSSGNVGIGTNSPTHELTVGDANAETTIGVAGSRSMFGFKSDLAVVQGGSGKGIQFNVNNNTFGSGEAMRIDSSGNLLVGKTVTTLNTEGHALTPTFARFTRDSAAPVQFNRTTSDGDIVIFYKDGTSVGSVSVTGSATTYNTSSDQRLKDNIVNAPSASDDIDAIQVRSFNWKADGAHQKYGMVAQELQSVAPEAVTGDADSDDMMGVDYSKLVPMMLKEIQSLRARVAQLEGDN